jgi:hypothetical protein
VVMPIPIRLRISIWMPTRPDPDPDSTPNFTNVGKYEEIILPIIHTSASVLCLYLPLQPRRCHNYFQFRTICLKFSGKNIPYRSVLLLFQKDMDPDRQAMKADLNPDPAK